MAEAIPVRSFFHMLAYAWSHYRPEQLRTLSSADFGLPADFLASLVCDSIFDIFRSGVSRRHTSRTEKMRTIRGRVDISRSLLSPDFAAGVLVCKHPTVEVGTVENEILKASLKSIVLSKAIDSSTRKDARALYYRFEGVRDVSLSKRLFRLIRVDRSMKMYRFPLSLCELMFENGMIDGNPGKRWFREYVRDEAAMRRLFEAFVGNLLRHRLPTANVIIGRKFSFSNLEAASADRSLIPSMRTDVIVENRENALVIDTKFTGRVLQNYFGNETLRSEHLYQIQSYVSHYTKYRPDAQVRGLVLYPMAKQKANVNFKAMDQAYSFCTLNLDQDWRQIEADLLDIVSYRIGGS